MLDHEGETLAALRVARQELDDEQYEDELAKMQLVADAALGSTPENLEFKLVVANNAIDTILEELKQGDYDLLVLGAGEGLFQPDVLLVSLMTPC